MAVDPTAIALWSSGLASSSLICCGVPIAFAFCALTIRSNQAWASAGSKVTASALKSSLPFWRTNAPNRASDVKADATPNGTPALAATSAATSIIESHVQVVSSGRSILAFSKIAGLAKISALFTPALMPTSWSLILPESTVPSANFDTSTLDRSSRACRVPYSAM